MYNTELWFHYLYGVDMCIDERACTCDNKTPGQAKNVVNQWISIQFITARPAVAANSTAFDFLYYKFFLPVSVYYDGKRVWFIQWERIVCCRLKFHTAFSQDGHRNFNSRDVRRTLKLMFQPDSKIMQEIWGKKSTNCIYLTFFISSMMSMTKVFSIVFDRDSINIAMKYTVWSNRNSFRCGKQVCSTYIACHVVCLLHIEWVFPKRRACWIWLANGLKSGFVNQYNIIIIKKSYIITCFIVKFCKSLFSSRCFVLLQSVAFQKNSQIDGRCDEHIYFTDSRMTRFASCGNNGWYGRLLIKSLDDWFLNASLFSYYFHVHATPNLMSIEYLMENVKTDKHQQRGALNPKIIIEYQSSGTSIAQILPSKRSWTKRWVILWSLQKSFGKGLSLSG